MKAKLNFVNRSQEPKNKSRVIDAQKIIDHFLSLHPDYRVNPDSPLYRLAVKQYNQNIKNTKVRPTIPKWFCGKVDAETGQLAPLPSDESLRASAGYISDQLPPTTPPVPVDLTNYPVDNCLILGTPGSHGYAQCKENLTDEEISVSGIDWVSSMITEIAAEGSEGSGGGQINISMSDAEAHEGGVVPLSCSFDGSSVSMSWGAHDEWDGSDGMTDSVACFIWQKDDGSWEGGYMEYIAIGSTSESYPTKQFSGPFGTHKGPVGFFVADSGSKGSSGGTRSDICFTTWN